MCSPLLSSGHVTSQLFKDKNTIVNILNMSHSIRLRKIDKRESDMLCNIYQWQILVAGKVRDPHTQGDGAQTGLAQVAGTLSGERLPDLCWTLTRLQIHCLVSICPGFPNRERQKPRLYQKYHLLHQHSAEGAGEHNDPGAYRIGLGSCLCWGTQDSPQQEQLPLYGQAAWDISDQMHTSSIHHKLQIKAIS